MLGTELGATSVELVWQAGHGLLGVISNLIFRTNKLYHFCPEGGFVEVIEDLEMEGISRLSR